MNKKHLLLLSSFLLVGSCFSAYEVMTNLNISNTSIAENTLSGTLIGDLSTMGGINPYRYSFVNETGAEDNDKFYISGNQLYLKFNPDYENPINSGATNTYNIRIKSTDTSQPVFAKDMTDQFNADGWFWDLGQYANFYNFAGIRADSSIMAWGYSNVGGKGFPTGTGFIKIFSNYQAYAALKNDGSLSVWGYTGWGGDGGPTGTGYINVSSNGEALAALKNDGSISVWGLADVGGIGGPSGTGFISISSTRWAFAALRNDGSIATWGSGLKGGSGGPTSTGFVKIFGGKNAFVAMKADGSLVAWGTASYGGSGAPTATGFTSVVGGNYAFAALKPNGGISSWGFAGYGGNGAPTGTGYVKIFGNGNAFAAMKADGSITAWGHALYGGAGAPTRSGYIKAIGGGNAYAALKDDGSIATRGWASYGGAGGPIDTGYVNIYATYQAFAAMKADGSIATRGWASYGGAGGPTGTGFINIRSTADTFIAIKEDGSIFTWGGSAAQWAGNSKPDIGAVYTKDIAITISDIDEISPTGTVAYTPADRTFGNVVASVTLSEPATITNNSGNTTYTFERNGEFTFEFVDAVGLTGNITAKVDWIDGNGAGVIITKDECPNGDTSASYYDKLCKPTTSGGGSSDGSNSTETNTTASNSTETSSTGSISTGTSETGNELVEAYKRSLENHITSMNTIEKARVQDPLTRAEMAKMMVNYAVNNLGKEIDTSRQISFDDIQIQTEEMQKYINQAYQLGLMGINVTSFNPNGLVTRAEFATVLARLLYDTTSNQNEPYYTKAIETLRQKDIITNTNPLLQEVRGYVMLMLMRSSQ